MQTILRSAGGTVPPGSPAPHHETSDHLELVLPAHATALVIGDLHLRQTATAASRQAEREIAERVARVEGPGAVVLNGDLIELWGEPAGTVEGALGAHPVLARVLRDFASAPERHVVLVVGNHDARLGWDDDSVRALNERTGSVCTLVADLVFTTPAGPRRVRCEHGHAFDPANAISDPRNPLDSPLGQHLVQEVLPQADGPRFLHDLAGLADPNAAAQFVTSRLLYRQLGPRSWWLLVPMAASLTLRVPPVAHLLTGSDELEHLRRWLPIAVFGIAVNVIGVVVVLALLARSVYSAMASSRLGARGARLNGAPRAAAAALCADGLAGLITAHTHKPELTPVPGGFYANAGCCQRTVERRPARLGLPAVFVPLIRRSWLELDVERELRIRLVLAETGTGETTLLERLVRRRRAAVGGDLHVVATVPGEAGWPLPALDLDRRRRQERVRSRAAMAITAVALLNLVSTLTLPIRPRLLSLLQVLPVEVPQTAAASLAFLSVALLLLGRGLRRGHRLAWSLAVTALAAAVVLNIVKGIDVEEATVAAVAGGWLARQRAAFPVRPDSRALRWPVWVLAAAGLVLAASAGLVMLTGPSRNPDAGLTAVTERLLGNSTATSLPFNLAYLTPILLATGFATLLACGLLLTSSLKQRRQPAEQRLADRERARRIVERHGGDTLAYFALRDDKSWFFTGDCLVAYALRDGVCLVSPDPIGPPEQWASAWVEFAGFADRHGWPVTVIGAGAGWLPIYQAAGMRSMYIGDEAIVDCRAFSLEGRPMKGLRGAHRRVQRAGFTVRFLDPATLPPALAAELGGLLGKSRRGQVERGFSMTLSRVFDPADTGLLLAVAFRPDGTAAGFCQWTPAADISGWSLDLMRRDADPELPNGLTDFIVIETINHLKANGSWGLSLNFAVMRAVLAGEQGNGVLMDLQRRLLNRFSDTMQIASLWRYNEKFKPYWRPRYVAISRLSSAPAQSLALADAEGVTELPLIGRFLGRPQQSGVEAAREEGLGA